MEERYVDEDALERFERALTLECRALGTIENYVRTARAFSSWLGGTPVAETTATRWRDGLLETGYAPASVNAMVAAVNKLFRVLGWESCRTRSLRLQRKLFRDDARELTRDEYSRLVFSARSRGRLRIALVMEAICSTGIRVSELSYLTVEAVRRGRATVSLKGKVRTVLVPRELARRLLAYASRTDVKSGPIFVTRSGKALSRGQVWAEMKEVAARAGIVTTKVFPHNLRHLFARAFNEVCHDVVRLADVLGHSSIETTRIYLISTGVEYERDLERMDLLPTHMDKLSI